MNREQMLHRTKAFAKLVIAFLPPNAAHRMSLLLFS